MNQTKKTILLAALFAFFLSGATVSYKYLSGKYTPPAMNLPTLNAGNAGTDVGSTSTLEKTDPVDATNGTDLSVDAAVSENSAYASDAEATPDTAIELNPARDFTVQNANGEWVNLSDFRGKPVIINFWATWCGPCKSELPAFDAAYQTHGDKVNFLMVNLTDGTRETTEKVNSFIEKNGYTFPVLFDSKSSGAMTYSVYSIPLTVFVDAKGNLLGSHTGAMSAKTLEEYIDTLLTHYAEP